MRRAPGEHYKEIASQNVGAALIVHGTVVLTPEAKQPLEMKAASIEVEVPPAPDYPLQKKRHRVEFSAVPSSTCAPDEPVLRSFRVRSCGGLRHSSVLPERGFVYVHTPIITASDCEGAGEMFRVTTLDPENPPMDSRMGRVDLLPGLLR